MAYDGSTQRKSLAHDRACKWEKRGDALFLVQGVHCTFWQTQAEIFYPERADFTTIQAEGADRYAGIYTSIPQTMRRDLANNLGSMLRPRGEDWFKAVVRPGKLMKQENVRAWCEHVTERQREIMYAPNAGFARAMAESDNDYATIGNAIVALTDNHDRSGLLFTCIHPRDCAWAENAEGVIDELHRKITMTLVQLARLFGETKLPREWQQRLKDHPHDKKTIRQCVAPIDLFEYGPGEHPHPKFRFASIYYIPGEKEPFLGEGFFTAFPFLVRRWTTVSGEAYGRSPCASVALADASSLNAAEMSLLKAIEWTVDPPKMVRDEVVLGEVRLEAGGLTAVAHDYDGRNGKAVENFDVGDPKWGVEYVRERNHRMGLIWFQNVLKLPDRELTAYEARERLKMLVREASPIIEPMEADNARLCDTTYEKCDEHNAFDPAPDEIINSEVTYEFETPLTAARKELKAANVMAKTANFTAMREVWPDVVDIADSDEMGRDMMSDVPASYLRKPEEIEQMRAERAAQRAEREKAALAMEMGKTVMAARPENLKMAEQQLGSEAQAGGMV